MLNKKPEVSIVIRTKNEEKFIGKVLKLLFRQTYKNFEIIIVDSGSVDKTLDIARRFPVRVLQIKQSDFTYGYSLNFGIEHAKGEYICILSAHSIPISDSWLADGLKILKGKRVASVTGYYSEWAMGYLNRPIGSLYFIFHKYRKDNWPWITNTNSFIKKSLWKNYPFDGTLPGGEDYDWGKEMLARGYNVIGYKPFSVFHSHKLIGRPGYWQMLPIWKKWNAIIDKKKRPTRI